jgi:predicted transcriptional regulator
MPTDNETPGKTSVTFVATTAQNAALAAIGARTDRKRSYLIREAIDEYIERHRQTETANHHPGD